MTSKATDPRLGGMVQWSGEILRGFLSEADGNIGKELIFYRADLDGLWQDFQSEFEIIEAAGGVVSNRGGQVLFIFRYGKWDLPKGKIDQGESIKEAALREVKEECGFRSLDLGEPLPITYHIYKEKGKEILKVTHWFRMYSEDTDLRPQVEEGISELRWAGRDDLRGILSNTYPNIALLLEEIPN